LPEELRESHFNQVSVISKNRRGRICLIILSVNRERDHGLPDYRVRYCVNDGNVRRTSVRDGDVGPNVDLLTWSELLHVHDIVIKLETLAEEQVASGGVELGVFCSGLR